MISIYVYMYHFFSFKCSHKGYYPYKINICLYNLNSLLNYLLDILSRFILFFFLFITIVYIFDIFLLMFIESSSYKD